MTIGWDKLFAFGMALPALTLYAYLGLRDAFLFVIVASLIFGIGTYFLTIDSTGKTLEQADWESNLVSKNKLYKETEEK